jgi:cell division septation protein DedD
VQVGAYLLKDNAEAMHRKLKAIGFDAFIVKE